MIGKKVYRKGMETYEQLSEQEKESVLNRVLQENIKELKRVIEAVDTENLKINRELAIQLLFEKQGTQSFSVLNSELEKKILRIKYG
ncbi:MAG: hypothetical protein QXG18_02780 [Candidatus Pacearchaeota archaeon]